MNLSLIGDTHGNMEVFKASLELGLAKHSHVIHVGDVGIGMPGVPDLNLDKDYIRMLECARNRDLWAGFIRGNHDNPAVCRSTAGFIEDCDVYEVDGFKIMTVAGAFSPDYKSRVPGLNWWHDEELNMFQMQAALTLYLESAPDIMITHTAPPAFIRAMNMAPNEDRTSNLLGVMFQAFAPKYWFCGHFHNDTDVELSNNLGGRTRFRCLNTNELLSMVF